MSRGYSLVRRINEAGQNRRPYHGSRAITGQKEVRDVKSQGRFQRRMARCAQAAPEQGERIHPAARSIERRAARVALGQGRKTLCVRWSERQRKLIAAVSGEKPADRLSLYVSSELERRMSELLVL